MNELNKIKSTQLPYIIKDIEGNYVGQISASINHGLTNVSFVMSFPSENKVINNKALIKQSYKTMQHFLEEEMISCGWGFLFEEDTSIENPGI